MKLRPSNQRVAAGKVIATVSLKHKDEGRHVGTARFFRLPVSSAEDYACEPPEALDFAKAQKLSERVLEMLASRDPDQAGHKNAEARRE